jgi:hypothetical protein
MPQMWKYNITLSIYNNGDITECNQLTTFSLTKCAILFSDSLYYNITLTPLHVSIPYGIIIRELH